MHVWKPIPLQGQNGDLLTTVIVNDDISNDFSRPLKTAATTKKYLIVPIDWPKAYFLGKPFTDTLSKIVGNHRAFFWIPGRIRTDLGLPFHSERFRHFCRERSFEHIEYLVGVIHWGDKKIERCIRTITEQLRASKLIFTRGTIRDCRKFSSLYARWKDTMLGCRLNCNWGVHMELLVIC